MAKEEKKPLNFIPMQDVNGDWVLIDRDYLLRILSSNGTTILGMNLECIFEFRNLYIEMGGSEPITPESVRKILGLKYTELVS